MTSVAVGVAPGFVCIVEREEALVKVVQFVTLMLFSLVTGVFWGTWFSLSRSIGDHASDLS